uniref:RIH_assoc domain-containing protein n=1 Tax=Macrostomum lignano TaxID=282301 RepID=A0A1I8G215_9PLAT
NHLFDRLEALLSCAGAESHLALALVEVFTGNKDTCMKVLPQHIAKIMSLVAQYGSRVPEFLDLLNTIVKVEELDLPLKRNQECIMTYLMQHRADIAQCLDQNPGVQFRLLRSGTRTPESDFMVALVDLLATCAEGENKSIESKNQSIYRVGEVLNVLTDPGISAHNKRPYARFLLWVYLNTASGLIESGAGDLPHDAAMWKLLGMWRQEFKQAASLANENPRLLLLALKSTSAVRHSNEDWQTERATQNIHDTLKYLFEGVLPVISSFFKTVYLKDQDNYPGEIEEVNRLTLAAMEFVDAVLPLLTNKKYFKYLITGATSLVSVCTLPSKDDELPLGKEFQQHMACFIDTNYGYSDPRRFAMTGKLVEQLCISNQLELRNEKERIEQEILDVKCLQLLRGAVHNEIVKQPDNVDSDEYKRRVASSRIAQVQNAVNGHQAMLKVLPNLVKPSDNIAREVLNFLAAMLYNGNADVQESMYEYFNSTREEKFFFTMHDRISMSSNSLRENRALINQQRSKIDEKMMELRSQLDLLNKDPDAAKNLRSTEQGARLLHFLEQKSKSGGGAGSHARGMHHHHHQQHQQQPISKSALFADLLPSAWRNSSNSSRKSFPDTDSRTRQDSPGSTAEVAPTGTQTLLRLNKTDIEDLATQIVMEDENLQMKDDGHIELVLRVLAFICDGQNTHLQDYLREQPDNMKSYNLVSKTVEYLSLVYISVTRSNISLVTQLIKTLLEFSSGNLKNQIVCYDSKVCDYLNYLLRSQQIYNKCDFDEEMELKTAIAELIMALIEENIRCDKDSEAAGYAQILGENSNGYSKAKPNSVVVKDTIGPEVVCQMFADFYERYHSPHLQLDKDDREDLLNVGFKYFHIFKRFQDLERGKELRLEDYLNFRPSVANLKEEICKFYESNTMSIEVLKDGNLQKVYFRVRDKKVLRQEVKDEFKYEVDRSSAANKLRDFCDWLKEIINDIQWQKRVLSSRVGAFFVHGWKAFNMACILLSLIICCIVLATWKASNDAGNPIPIRPKPYSTAVLVLGIAHNIFSLFVLISYFLCNKPYVPTREKVNAYWW